MAVTDIAAKYPPVISWFYDRVAADAVLNAVAGLIGHIQDHVGGGGAVLEIGCGGGQFVDLLAAKSSSISVTGVDLSAEQIARAATRSRDLSADYGRVDFRIASAVELPFADGSFDVAVSIASVKHWPDRQKGVAEMVRVLKDGGLLLVAEADRGCHLADARRFVRSTHLPAPLREPYLWLFRAYVAGQGIDLDDAREMVARQGLLDASVQRIAGTPFLMFAGTKREPDPI